MQVAIIGLPGCGKGTQSKRLAAELDVSHLSTGEMLRDAMADSSSLKEEIAARINRGDLASDEFIMELVIVSTVGT